ncbi:MAG: transposase [Firmicutes bacterium]|nr:transposase [Bacillota bacterium]
MDEAEKSFDSLYSWMRRCRLQPMKEVAEALMRHKDKILAYFKNRVTNAICEGISSMIQAAKRKARGFRTFEGFSSMIYLVAGKLQLAVPSPF